ncbi:DUF4189 domain-containing protein [Methylobacterium oxalidis]|uniref:DUF4189 domain-containing protein n=1 Tax=Methylobacterium oxalidis TaxID=944322 RepID=A0A512J5P3_9HYPH|nr:DUF4189 domain-containing protein [Methylobacterium oxalidis]GEP05230.1 hypothetical protein MOX02_32680 [Methylobacterium oxalidis]GJE34230.1 hypothetical protein LDDCCGHA_4437 [Methylobacterium oxalidis]GLS66352.1 hypothetical protein GCM10007888_47350 [Methylobacterium oxalidis]
MKRARLAVVAAVSILAMGGSGVFAQESGWVAVATNGHGAFGYAYGKSSADAARETALSGCGAPGCHIEVVQAARCFAYVKGDQTYGVGVGPSSDAAIGNATKFCSTGPGCRTVKAGCG